MLWRMLRVLAILAAVAALALAACGDDEEPDATTAAPATESEAAGNAAKASDEKNVGGGEGAAAGDGTELKVASSQFGEVLFDSGDQAVYLFDKESSSKPECYGECAAAWPPVLTEGDPVPGQGVDAKLLGTTERDDGSTQVTYKGQPLYFYAHEGPGEVLCHNVDEFGGLWLVLDAAGSALS